MSIQEMNNLEAETGNQRRSLLFRRDSCTIELVVLLLLQLWLQLVLHKLQLLRLVSNCVVSSAMT